MRGALVVGATGQTGAYLTRELVSKRIPVVATSRTWNQDNMWRLAKLGLTGRFQTAVLRLDETRMVEDLISEYQPSVIFYLAGPSRVSDSFEYPEKYMSQIYSPVITFLEVLKKTQSSAHFINASSTDCFGNQPGVHLEETSPLRPLSPYAIAKAASFWAVRNYRESFRINASNGILTNHESPLRDRGFVTRKIIEELQEIAAGRTKKLHLGSTAIVRDWMWAGDVAKALRAIYETDISGDYLIASGQSASLQDMIELACENLGLNAAEVIIQDETLVRPSEIIDIRLNPSKSKRELGWEATYNLSDIVKALLLGELT